MSDPSSVPVRAVLFDLDGVLVDSFEVWVRVMDETARELGYPAIERAQIEESWGQGIQSDIARYYPRSNLTEIAEHFEVKFVEHLDHLVTQPGAGELLQALRARALPVALITNTPHELARRMLAVAGLEIDPVVGGTDVPAPKPAPDMVRRACELLGVAPREVIVVGDSRYDLEAAVAAGARFVGYGGIESEHRIAHLGELVGWLEAVAAAPGASPPGPSR